MVDKRKGSREVELKSLILTDTRVLIADLFVRDGIGSAPTRLTADEISKTTGLSSNMVSTNMRALPESGWFMLDWEDIDPYDFTRFAARRRLFLAPGVRDALALCVKDFRARRAGRNAEGRAFQVEYVPPRVDHGEPVDGYVPVSTWELGGATVSTARAALLIHCFERPTEFHHASEVGPLLGVGQNTALRLLVRCEEAGLMVSTFRSARGSRPLRVFKLTATGVAVARSVAERTCGGDTTR